MEMGARMWRDDWAPNNRVNPSFHRADAMKTGLLEAFAKPKEGETMAEQQQLRAEGASLDEARTKLQTMVPAGMEVVDERVIADGSPRNLKGSGLTVDAAFEEAVSQKPAESEVLDRNITTQPKSERLVIEAFDDETAQRQAESKCPGTARLVGVTMETRGRSGFFGIGKRPNTYEAHIDHWAAVQVTVSGRAIVEAVVAPAIPESRQEEIRGHYHTCREKANDAARHRILEEVRVHPGQDPYMAAHSALLQEHDRMARSADSAAEKETVSKYGITPMQLKSVLARK